MNYLPSIATSSVWSGRSMINYVEDTNEIVSAMQYDYDFVLTKISSTDGSHILSTYSSMNLLWTPWIASL